VSQSADYRLDDSRTVLPDVYRGHLSASPTGKAGKIHPLRCVDRNEEKVTTADTLASFVEVFFYPQML